MKGKAETLNTGGVKNGLRLVSYCISWKAGVFSGIIF
jgi:hypothetical protein